MLRTTSRFTSQATIKWLKLRQITGMKSKKNTLAVSIENTAGEGYTKQWDVNGEEVTFTVAKC